VVGADVGAGGRVVVVVAGLVGGGWLGAVVGSDGAAEGVLDGVVVAEAEGTTG